MLEKIFDIEKFNIISDEENYYFFRALNMADNKDIETGTTLDELGIIKRIRTDRERYEGTPKYDEDNQISLEEMFNHIKMHHRTDTNCISLTSNANAAVMYGRGYYKDKYIMVKVPKKEFGDKVINAGLYMMEEINKRIEEYILDNELDEMQKYYLDSINNARSQEALDRIMKMRKQDISDTTTDMFERGITYRHMDTTSVDYQALDSEQNFQKNKLIAKLDIIEKNMLPQVRNKFLIQTLGNAFSSLELIHYKDIEQEEILEVPTEIVDVFAILQQLPKDNAIAEQLKQELIEYATNNNSLLHPKFSFNDYELNSDEEYTIEKMYNLTDGNVNFHDSINLYKKSFYLAKSKLRAESASELIYKITNNDAKYSEAIEYLRTSTYGVEPEIFSRLTSNKLNVSESVSLDFSPKEREVFNFINGLSNEELSFVLDNPTETLKYLLKEFPSIEHREVDQETYYANAIIDLFDWSKIDVATFSDRQRNHIFESLKQSNVVEIYNALKEKGVKEKDIANALLTIVIKEKPLEMIQTLDLKETFTVEELEDFLGYYKINNTKGLKLRSYQAQALKNVDKIFKTEQFASAILPTGAGKSFVALAEMLEHSNEDILYLAPNDEILNQIRKYILNIICEEDLTKTDEEKIKERFPKLKLCTYQSLLSDNKNGILNDKGKEQKTVNNKYGLIVFDELHRTGASEWEGSILTLLENQDENTKVLGITATPQRDADYRNMANEWAEYFGYSEEEIIKHKHLAINMDLYEAIRLGYVVNPKVVNCEYTLKDENGLLDNLLEKINLITDEEEKGKYLTKFDDLRRRVEQADGVGKILRDNVKQGGKYIVFCPIVNKDGTALEDDFGYNTDSRLSSEDVIQKYKDELTTHLGSEFDLEFYSMLGKYGTARNERQLDTFEKDEPGKVKLMVVMNKLNEGVHVKDVDGIIWYRPLDENSNILFHQQLGRIIHAIDPNGELPDDKRPIVIDLVNNTLRVNLEKEQKEQISDLDKITMIVDWIEHHDSRIPDLNSSDRIESSYGTSLKHIQEKYSEYANNLELLENMSEKEKIETLSVIEIANNIDLWNVDFPEKIKKENTNSITSDFSSFELTEILRDYCELENVVDNILFVPSQEKKEELIKTIHELGRLPKQKEYNGGISERVFRNGEDQRVFYATLQKGCRELSEKENLTDDEKQKKDDYEEIQRVLASYQVSQQEKKEELIKTIHELGKLPKAKSDNDGISERVFRNGEDQRVFYATLQVAYRGLKERENLTDVEQQIKEDYEEIQRVLASYQVSPLEKKEELIKTIHELGRLPKLKEKIFRNGKKQRSYYDNLKKSYKEIGENENLTDIEQQIKEDYEEIQRVLTLYQMSPQEKKEELIKTIHELGRLPKKKGNNGGNSERIFRDGEDQREFYATLQRVYIGLKERENLTDVEQQKNDDYEEIQKVLELYQLKITPLEKKEELIKTIHELGRLPNGKDDDGISERIFGDGTDQRRYYDRLQTRYKKLEGKEILTDQEQQTKEYYEEIQKALELYPLEITWQEKKEELIKTIHELGKLPKVKSDNDGISERIFRDGTDQRIYYQHLKTRYKKLEGKETLTDQEQQIKEDYEEIQRVLTLYQMSPQEKKEELIKTIHELGKLPKVKSDNDGISERIFRDGTDQRSYYGHLKERYKSIEGKESLTDKEQQTKEDYEEIQKVLLEQQKIGTTDSKKKMLMDVRNILEDAKNVAFTESIVQITDDTSNHQKK